ncbi:MAG: FecR domain-containing protein [Bacteroidota bacterium]
MNLEKDDTFLAKWLNGELSEEEKNAFEASTEGKDFKELIQVTEQIEFQKLDIDKDFHNLQSQINDYQSKNKTIKMKPSYWVSIAASVSIIVTIFYLFTLDTTIKTGNSEREIVSLPDGSVVHMNVASSLSFSDKNWNENRTLELDGEGFFEVNEGSKFTVKTSNGDISVLGTSFNVRSRRTSFEVSCYSGKVEIFKPSYKQQLLPGQAVRFEKNDIVKSEGELTEIPFWKKGIIKLENAPFARVLEELSYVFDIKVEYDESLNDLVYTGSFNDNDLKTALSLVCKPLKVNYQFESSSKTLKIQGLRID